MITGPKYKICRRLGAGVFEKCQTQKFALAEANTVKPRKTGGGRSGGSSFGVQLLEKQKARFSYGISERQFFRYVKEAMARKGGNSANDLVSRLDAQRPFVTIRTAHAAFIFGACRSSRKLTS
jgi:small subunit ribosomal protein S4